MISLALVAVAVLIAMPLGYAATKPGTFRVQRATRIDAPPEKIFALVNDPRRWSAWSPYEAKDPALQRAYSGPASGRGAVCEFDGNRAVGKGRLTITDSVANSRVVVAVDMFEPFEAHNVVEYTLRAEGDATNVTWAMVAACPYPARIIGMFINMDRMIGTDFEAGLARLKAIAEEKGPA